MTSAAIKRAGAMLQYGALGVLVLLLAGLGGLIYAFAPRILDQWERSITAQTNMVNKMDNLTKAINGFEPEMRSNTRAIDDLRREIRAENR